MSGLFGGNKAPAPVEPQPVPTIDQAAQDQDQSDMRRRRRGFAATTLVPDTTGSAGLTGLGGATAMATKPTLGA